MMDQQDEPIEYKDMFKQAFDITGIDFSQKHSAEIALNSTWLSYYSTCVIAAAKYTERFNLPCSKYQAGLIVVMEKLYELGWNGVRWGDLEAKCIFCREFQSKKNMKVFNQTGYVYWVCDPLCFAGRCTD